MQAGARLQAAIDIFTEICTRGRAASVALADWGKAHRFAGAGDRSAIGNLMFDMLRRKQSLAAIMDSESARAVALAAMRYVWNVPAEEITALCSGEGYGPAPLSSDEVEKLTRDANLEACPDWVRGDYPEWLSAPFTDAFGASATAEGAALATRAPIDLRVNTFKATREKVLTALLRHSATPTPYSPLGVRLPAPRGYARSPNVDADPAHGRGWFEMQDEGSQIAALLAGAGPRMQVADLCAGAGGKTLALSAIMQNTGQIHAYDADATRFRPIFERLKRAGARNVQTLPPGQPAALDTLTGKMDLVVVDAPCSGSGAWRRRPDTKWRLTCQQLAARIETQAALLDLAARLVKPAGRIAYITCSVLPEENWRQVEAFLERHRQFSAVNPLSEGGTAISKPLANAAPSGKPGILLTPAQHGTDGFYIVLLTRGT